MTEIRTIDDDYKLMLRIANVYMTICITISCILMLYMLTFWGVTYTKNRLADMLPWACIGVLVLITLLKIWDRYRTPGPGSLRCR